ncbi:hypothetical protein M409DRAFT_24319 [Zasmidium cellare ATCC 36951]|uniref:N-acetyltransferase domain-containing protein n=1 Tax=Zasmidium cellare ATCC 36951 TaxID=1080233 RepID=A0A6A6CIE2_ZASCE|nr:uncharacterized protein M409DRAFT_24319 [Zasmidium cellare ATCC 36951]KAF2165469.1 hypothetical protein M409DRAFT_24319 [Zasmidium cellare ATCC 36951]
MPLQILPLPRSEFEQYYNVCWTAFVPGIMDMMWPDGRSKEDIEYSVAGMRRTDERYPGRMHCFKVIDTDLPDTDPFDKVVGVSHWKIFPHERSEEELQKEKELSDKDDELYPDPPGYNKTAMEDFGACTKAYKDKYIGRRPYMLLQVIGTRDGHQRRGVGAISMKWGTEKADELGLPLYLEATAKGEGLYRKWGFQEVDVLPFDARKHGYPDPLTHLIMLRPPQQNAKP